MVTRIYLRNSRRLAVLNRFHQRTCAIMRELWPALLLLSEFIVLSIQTDDLVKPPTVFVAIFIRNRAVTLPYFLTYFTRIDYPKNRIRVRIHCDASDNVSAHVVETWMETWNSQYHLIELKSSELAGTEDHTDAYEEWQEIQYARLIELREDAMESARLSWADYAWLLDCDALLTDSRTLIKLISHRVTVAAPMLLSDEWYSNFWGGMTSSYYYRRTDEYMRILHRKKEGCFTVPMVHSAILIDLRSRLSDKLTFVPDKVVDYDGPIDDIITFAVGANRSGVPLHICNDAKYGYVAAPPGETGRVRADENNLLNLQLRISVDDLPLELDDLLSPFVNLPQKVKFGFDEIFVINLARRNERKVRMKYCLDQLGVDAKFVEAVDGRLLEDSDLDRMGITFLPGYEDPYHKRPMKKGEVGCFLSHYNIWRETIDRDLSEVLILEDDVRFEKNFVQRMEYLVRDVRRFPSLWDLIYIGRKIMKPDGENYVDGSDYLVYPDYTYWTIGYVLSRKGAEKLVNAEPLSKLLPIDEFLPIMFDKHPSVDWKANFPTRNLQALSVHPLMIAPVKYTNEEGYLSDTENSHVVNVLRNKVQSDEL